MIRSLRFLAITLFAAAFSSLALGQGITTGTIKGAVVDPSGAVVPNAQIIATNNAQGTRLQTVSTGDGSFAFYAVPIGVYTISIDAPGFANLKETSVQVNSGATTNLKAASLRVSATTQVEVNGSTEALLPTSDSQVTTTFSAQTISNLPLSNSFDTVTEVIPGVVSTHMDNFSNTSGDNFSVNGQSGRYNNFEFDGQSDNDNTIGGPQIFFGNQDAIQEVQVITNDYSAQYGRNSGAVVNYITKSGTNAFHGSAFEYYQGSFLSSFENQQKNPLFGFCGSGQSPSTSDCATPVLPRSVENRYGGTLGGPILKNKLFFFGSTYWDKVRTGVAPSASTTLTPTPAGLQQLAGAFPNNPSVAILQGYGPYAIKEGNPTAVPGTTQLENVTGPGGVTATNVPFSLVQRTIASPYDDQEHLGRLDWQPTGKDHLFLRYFYQTLALEGVQGTANDIPSGAYVTSTDTVHTIGADWSHTFNDHWVDQLRYSFQQASGAFQGGGYPHCTISSTSECPASVTFNDGSENFGLDNIFPQGRVVKVTQVQNNATWTHGNHTVLFGGELDYQNSPSTFLPNFSGGYVYGSFSNFIANAPLPGQPASNALLNIVDGDATTKFTEIDAAGYVQDDWKVSPTFTAHIGLRWEYFSPAFNVLHSETVARESNPATAFWDPTLPITVRTAPNVSEFYKGFEPRIGFAWNPVFDSKLVVRGGYAINRNPGFYNIFSLSAGAAPVANSGSIACTGSNCLPANGDFTAAQVQTVNLPFLPRGGDPRLRDQSTVPSNFLPPYTQTYTLGIDHQLGSAAVGEIRYVGSLTLKNFQSIDSNPFLLPVQQAFPAYAPVSLCQDTTSPNFGRTNCNFGNVALIGNGGWANYNGLQMNITSRNYHGITGTLSYTYSKTLDNATDAFRSTGSGGSSIAFAQNPLNTGAGERGVSGNDLTNAVGGQFAYQLPKFAKGNGLLAYLTNGFTLNGFHRFSSGQPYTNFQPIGLDAFTPDVSYCDGAFNADTNVAVGVDTCRLVLSNKSAPRSAVAYLNPYTGPVVNGSPTLGTPQYVAYGTDSFDGTTYNPGTPIDPHSAHWIVNNQAYAQLVGNPYPGSSRGIERGDTFSELDATIVKDTRITERVSLQLSMAAYNALNQMYRGAPGTFVANPITFESFDYSAGSFIPGNTTPSGTRYVLLGAKVIF